MQYGAEDKVFSIFWKKMIGHNPKTTNDRVQKITFIEI